MHQRQINEDRLTVAEAKEVRLLCPHCFGALYVKVPVNNQSERQRLIAEAVQNHRGLCDKAPPEAQRVYQIEYPRA